MGAARAGVGVLRHPRLLLVGPLLTIIGAAPVWADTLTSVPDQIEIAGTAATVEVRNVVLRATKVTSKITATVTDLTRDQGFRALQSSAVLMTTPTDLGPDRPVVVPVRIDLRNAPSGEYKGKILLVHADGELVLPVTVRVKDRWWLPLAILLVGLVLGVATTAYRTTGRPRDEVLVRVGRLRSQVSADRDFLPAFRSRIDAFLVDTEQALQSETPAEGLRAVQQAEAVWLKWRRSKLDWLAQFAFSAPIGERLATLAGNSPHVAALIRSLEDAWQTAPDLEGPGKLRERLTAIAGQANRYLALSAKLEQLNSLRPLPTEEQSEALRIKVVELQRRLDRLAPTDEAAGHEIEAALDSAIKDAQVLRRPATASGAGEQSTRDVDVAPERLLATAPTVSEVDDREIAGATTRLRIFLVASYVIAIALLGGAGFGELYWARPTFGANGWSDYFGLLAWGFGAEATRAAVVGAVKGWDLPGLK